MKPLGSRLADPELSMEDRERWIWRPMRLAFSWSSPLCLLLVIELACESAGSSCADHYVQTLVYAVGSLIAIPFACLIYYWLCLHMKAFRSLIKMYRKNLVLSVLLMAFLLYDVGFVLFDIRGPLSFMHLSGSVFFLSLMTFWFFSPMASEYKAEIGRKYVFVLLVTLIALIPAVNNYTTDNISIIFIMAITLFITVYCFCIVKELIKAMQATVDRLQSDGGSTSSRQT